MSEDLNHECGVAALYLLDEPYGEAGSDEDLLEGDDVLPFMPRVLLDLQNRGQLAAGFSTYNPKRTQLIDTFKDVGTVNEAFRMSHPSEHRAILREYAGRAAIGHTRYATVGADDARYAQPFERHHGRLWKWFAFGFNGTLSNYADLRAQLLAKQQYHFTLDTDTEMIMHALSYRLRGDSPPPLEKVMAGLARQFDGAYNLVFMDGMGRMFVARDPLGIRPMCWAVQGRMFAAASESVALTNIGFTDVKYLEPGEMAIVENGKLRFARFSNIKRRARCFFEWVYFANVASQIDGAGVYNSRATTGARLAELEDQQMDDDCIVVPVPDTAKAAADSYAYHMGIPCVEGIIRNRYVGRTFIQSPTTRSRSVKSKYTVLRSILSGKRVFLLEDSIVRSTTLRSLAGQIFEAGNAREVHIRVACPPIMAPCFYGIDMSTLNELFAPGFVKNANVRRMPKQVFADMAESLGVTSVRYLSVSDLGPCIGVPEKTLCTGCVTGRYPTAWGRKLMQKAKQRAANGDKGRTYEC